jgi:hypothetical protein
VRCIAQSTLCAPRTRDKVLAADILIDVQGRRASLRRCSGICT